jgi:hypothetical protein
MMVMMLGVLLYMQHNVVSVVTMVTGYEMAVVRCRSDCDVCDGQ